MTITHGYCALSDVRDFESGKSRYNGPEDDSIIEIAIEAASGEIDTFAGDQFYQELDEDSKAAIATAKYFNGHGLDTIHVRPWLDSLTKTEILCDVDEDGVSDWDELSLDSVETDGRTIRIISDPAYPDFSVFPDGSLFPEGKRNVRVTGIWGRAAVPLAVKEATILRAIERLNDQFDPTLSARSGALSLLKRDHILRPMAAGGVV